MWRPAAPRRRPRTAQVRPPPLCVRIKFKMKLELLRYRQMLHTVHCSSEQRGLNIVAASHPKFPARSEIMCLWLQWL